MKKLILIRHGETDYTIKNKFCGHEDIPLNKDGILQAALLKTKLESLNIEKVYSSDLKRAMQTAEILFSNKRIVKRKGLREIDFGKLSGYTHEQVNKLHPELFKEWLNHPECMKVPGGENIKGFTRRVLKTFSGISLRNKRNVVAIVSHGGPIRAILVSLLGLDAKMFWRIEQGVTALNVITFNKGIARVIKINDTAHLK
ncbi:MAG: histidine phosphatase family protein [Candidatus Omnitrophica bacterium]|nr:histidine phosphatase family protein [Candidatus Omnitrophota bacterium]